MKLTARLQRLNLAMTVVALLGGGLLLSACGTIAGAGQDVSNIGYSVSSGANQVQRQTNAP
ncbi:MAG TPA: entericidin [Stellaceae bacterium]|nr:entericidin [Stellaceae bacterium]